MRLIIFKEYRWHDHNFHSFYTLLVSAFWIIWRWLDATICHASESMWNDVLCLLLVHEANITEKIYFIITNWEINNACSANSYFTQTHTHTNTQTPPLSATPTHTHPHIYIYIYIYIYTHTRARSAVTWSNVLYFLRTSRLLYANVRASERILCMFIAHNATPGHVSVWLIAHARLDFITVVYVYSDFRDHYFVIECVLTWGWWRIDGMMGRAVSDTRCRIVDVISLKWWL